jgi:hypothetical protein
MAFEIQQFGLGDHGKGHHTHHDAGHKLHDEVHGLFNKIHHGLDKAKPHLNEAVHGLQHGAKALGGSAQRELNGTATPKDKHNLETAGKVAATILLPHVVIGSAIIKTVIKEASKNNVHVDVHVPVKHGDSKQ